MECKSSVQQIARQLRPVDN